MFGPIIVAPLAGAWIETAAGTGARPFGGVPPLKGDVDCNNYASITGVWDNGRPPRGGRGTSPTGRHCNITVVIVLLCVHTTKSVVTLF